MKDKNSSSNQEDVKKKEVKSKAFNSSNLIIGFVLLIVFLALWILTSLPKEDVDEVPFHLLPVEEQVRIVEEEIKESRDDANYARALVETNNYYCGYIESDALRKKCYDDIVVFVEPEVVIRTEEESIDDANYARALVLEDVSFCGYIVNDVKRLNCLGEFS